MGVSSDRGGWVCPVGWLCPEGGYVHGVSPPPHPRAETWEATRYGRQTGGTHPIGILSCSLLKSLKDQIGKARSLHFRVSGMGQMMADSMTMLSLSLGSKIGLINKLLSYDEPKSIKEIANDADLKERFGQVYFTLADPKGGRQGCALLSIQFLSCSCSFREKWSNYWLVLPPPLGVGAPYLGNPGPATVWSNEYSTENTCNCWKGSTVHRVPFIKKKSLVTTSSKL